MATALDVIKLGGARQGATGEVTLGGKTGVACNAIYNIPSPSMVAASHGGFAHRATGHTSSIRLHLPVRARGNVIGGFAEQDRECWSGFVDRPAVSNRRPGLAVHILIQHRNARPQGPCLMICRLCSAVVPRKVEITVAHRVNCSDLKHRIYFPPFVSSRLKMASVRV